MLSVCPCMYRNPHRHTTHTHKQNIYSKSDSPFQRSLPETRVHYCSLTSASRRITTGFSPSVTFLCFVATEWWWWWCVCVCVCVCVCESVRERWRRGCRVLSVYWWCSVVPPIVMCVFACVCVYVCTVSRWGYMCGAVCPPGLSPQWPQRRLSQRETEREKEGERVPLLSPHTHTLIIILLSGNQTFPLLTKLLSASSSTVAYLSRLICCNLNTS